jgi:hypothetical protein
MTLYYFNTQNDKLELDLEGTGLANMDQARCEALVLLGEMVRDECRHSAWNGTPWRIWVSNGPCGGGSVLFTVELSAT